MGGQVFTTAIIVSDCFKGTFDGNNHKIVNFIINFIESGTTFGLFLCIDYNGSIKNLGIENFSIDCYGGGALTGFNRGSISNCYSAGTITSHFGYVGGLIGINEWGNISNCYSTATVTGNGEDVGGLVGANRWGTISNCHSAGATIGFPSAWFVGGLAGWNESGTISNCYSTAIITGMDSSYCLGGLVGWNESGTISNCYSNGAVSGGTGSTNLGGLLGYYENGNIIGCYFLDVAGPDNGYGTPLTNSQMKQQASFVGWDFIQTWNIGENQTYPFLIIYPAGDLNYDGTVDFIDFAVMAENWLVGL